MIISHRQIQQLLVFCHQIICPSVMLTEQARNDLSSILTDIANQQSPELKEIK